MDVADLLAQLQRPSPAAEIRLAQAKPADIRANPPAVGNGRTVTLGDKQPFTKGPYFAWLAPWGAGSLVAGKDYTESLTLEPGRFPQGSLVRWSWPAKAPTAAGVYNFLAINFGDYYGTAVERPIAPRRIVEIAALKQTHDLAIGGALEGFDVLTDYFLTAEPGKHDRHLFEIEVFLHTPTFSKQYVASARQLGTYTDGQGRTWTAALNPNGGGMAIILFTPADRPDILRTTIDLQAMHVWLMARGVLSGREWFNGLGVGVEVRQDAGTLRYDNLSVEYR